ncbi:hypothetical protein AB0P15_10515 [Streptomyces sp. NPDC087917]|uniref:hypothetical protein n=1 Tax=Streptomyces sp. NPDC087917 TaxID=3155060 RepID=UPI00343BEE98
MRRTLTVAVATAAAALLLPVGSVGAEASPGGWSAREATAFWTPERMASAEPVPDPPAPDTAPAGAAPAADPAAPLSTPPGTPPAATPTPAPAGAPVAVPGEVVAGAPAEAPAGAPSQAPVAVPDPGPPAPAPDATTTTAAPVPPAAPSAPTPAATVPTPMATPTPVAAPTPTPTPTPTPSPTPTASASASPVPGAPAGQVALGAGRDFDGIPVVGRMFVMKGSGSYFCSASVVSSPGRNLVISAAHCLLGSDTRQVAFVPRYTRKAPRPYGLFPVVRDSAGRSRVWIDQRYRAQGAEKAATLDVAFAQVGPNAAGKAVEKAVGGNRLVTGATYAHSRVRLIGHPASAARPRVCDNRTTKFTSTDKRSPGSFLRINCTGYPGGTSGGPFIARFNAKTSTGDVVGVIGGWKTGGPTADTSYSAYFGADVRKLYRAAVAGARVG